MAKIVLHVSPDGNDASSGRPAKPNAAGTDGPLATIERARDVVRALPRPRPPVRVIVHGGVYPLDRPVEFKAADGGTADAPVTYVAAEGETPVLDAGRRITDWRRGGGAPGIPADARGAVWSAPVPSARRFAQLYCDGQPVKLAATVDSDDWETWPTGEIDAEEPSGLVVPAGALPSGDPCGSAVLNWLPTPYTRWSNALTPVVGVDAKQGVVRFRPIVLHRPEKLREIPWRLENVASGLTGPGRWFHDVEAGRIYLVPPENVADPNDVEVIVPDLPSAIVIRGTADEPVRCLSLERLTIRHTGLERPDESKRRSDFGARGAAVSMTGVEDVRVVGCRVTRAAGNAIRATGHVRRIAVTHCEISHIGGGAVLTGGGLKLPEASCRENVIAENHIHHCGTLYWHSAGISLGMSERSVVRNNEIHHMPYVAVASSGRRHRWFAGWPRRMEELIEVWREHGEGEPTIEGVKKLLPGHNRIERNLIHHVMMRLDDGAAIYCHAGHHNEVLSNVVYVTPRDGSHGLYFDDEEYAGRMEGNIVYRVPDLQDVRRGSALHLHNNARHTVVNNVFVGAGRLFTFPSSYGGHRIERNVFVFHGDPEAPHTPAPVRGPGDGRRQADYSAGPSTMDRNLYWTPDDPAAAKAFLEGWREQGFGAESIVADPLFVDDDGEDYRLRADSPAVREFGFEPIDTSDVGRSD